jgi:hypothetical protein
LPQRLQPRGIERALSFSKTEPGAKVLVWTLDFSRNTLMTVTDPGLINPALRHRSAPRPK